MDFYFDESRNIFVLGGDGVPRQKNFEETALLIISNFDRLDPTQIAESVIFAKYLNQISNENAGQIINMLKATRLDFASFSRLLSMASFSNTNIFRRIPFNSKIYLLRYISSSDALISAVWDAASQMESDAEMSIFVESLCELPAVSETRKIEQFSQLDDTYQVNFLLFCIVAGIDIKQIIYIQTKTHTQLLEIQGAINGGPRPQQELYAVIKANSMYSSIMLFLDATFLPGYDVSSLVELSPLLIMTYRRKRENRVHAFGSVLFQLIAKDKLQIIQLTFFFNGLKCVSQIEEKNFVTVFQRVIKHYGLVQSQATQLYHLSQVYQQSRQFCNYEELVVYMLRSDVRLSKYTVLSVFSEAVQYPAFVDAAVAFINGNKYPIPFSTQFSNLDFELKKYLYRYYNELYFYLTFPQEEHNLFVAFFNDVLHVDVCDIAVAYNFQLQLLHESRSVSGQTQVDNLDCKQAFALLYFIFMRDHYFYDEPDMQRDEVKILMEKAKFLGPLDEHKFEIAFLSNRLFRSAKLTQYAYYLVKSSLIGCVCLENDLLQKVEITGSPFRDYYNLYDSRISNIMNILHIIAREQIPITVMKLLQHLQRYLNRTSFAVNALSLLAFVQIVGYLNCGDEGQIKFNTTEEGALLFHKYLLQNRQEELGDTSGLEIRQNMYLEPPTPESTLRYHSEFCYQTNTFDFSLKVLQYLCNTTRMIDIKLQYGYFQWQKAISVDRLYDFLDEYAFQYIHVLNGYIFVQYNIYLASNELAILLTHVLIDLYDFISALQNYSSPNEIGPKTIGNGIYYQSEAAASASYLRSIYLKACKLHTCIVAHFCDIFRHFNQSESKKVYIQLLSNKCQILPYAVLEKVAETETDEALLVLYYAYQNQFFLETRLRTFQFKTNNNILEILAELSLKVENCSYLQTFSRSDEAFVQLRERLIEYDKIQPEQLKQVFIGKVPLTSFAGEMAKSGCKFPHTIFLTPLVRVLQNFYLEEQGEGCVVAQGTGVLSTFADDKIKPALPLFYAFCRRDPTSGIDKLPVAIFGEPEEAVYSHSFSETLLECIGRACAIEAMFASVHAGEQFELCKDKSVSKGIIDRLYGRV